MEKRKQLASTTSPSGQELHQTRPTPNDKGRPRTSTKMGGKTSVLLSKGPRAKYGPGEDMSHAARVGILTYEDTLLIDETR